MPASVEILSPSLEKHVRSSHISSQMLGVRGGEKGSLSWSTFADVGIDNYDVLWYVVFLHSIMQGTRTVE